MSFFSKNMDNKMAGYSGDATNARLLYLALGGFILYNLQGVIYVSGSIISQACLLVCIVIGLYYWVRSLQYCLQSTLIFAITCFLILNSVSYVFYTGMYSLLAFNHLKGILSCFLPFFIGFQLTTKNKINPRVFEYLFYILLVVNIFTFYRIQALLLASGSMTEDYLVNNIAYSFARLVPLMYFIRRNILVRVSLLLVVAYFILLGAKRGAIITGGFAIMTYLWYLINEVRKSAGTWTKMVTILSVVCFVVLVIRLVYADSFVVGRFEDGSSSGRDWIYSMIFNSWYSSNDLSHLLFGYGFIASMNFTHEKLAHNDWLEILSNFGIVGVVVYLGIYLSLVAVFLRSKFPANSRYAFISILLMWGVTTLFSTWYNSIDNFALMLLLGHLVVFPFMEIEETETGDGE